MARYSHSRISTFEQCKYKYKLQYIDKVVVEIPTTIECFMGDIVHRALEKLYKDLSAGKMNELKEILEWYKAEWEKEWDDNILIVKKQFTAEDYKMRGAQFVAQYYEKHKPFDQMDILGLETQDMLKLPDGNEFHIRIDKLGVKDGKFFVCDYKTNNWMKTQTEADNDRQLAMYSIWVRNKFGDKNGIVLMWHMLAFNEDVTSVRSDENLDKVQDEVVDRIKEIETCEEYPTKKSALCNYCIFKELCPEFTQN